MRILKARYRTAEAFLAAYQNSFAGGGLFFPTREHVTVGETVMVEVRFPELGDRVLLRSYVAWRRAARVREGTPAGVGVELDREESPKREFLLAVARGETPRAVTRTHRRLPTTLPARWHVIDGASVTPASSSTSRPAARSSAPTSAAARGRRSSSSWCRREAPRPSTSRPAWSGRATSTAITAWASSSAVATRAGSGA
jgi:Tfp pilus assembly protein PilZ